MNRKSIAWVVLTTLLPLSLNLGCSDPASAAAPDPNIITNSIDRQSNSIAPSTVVTSSDPTAPVMPPFNNIPINSTVPIAPGFVPQVTTAVNNAETTAINNGTGTVLTAPATVAGGLAANQVNGIAQAANPLTTGAVNAVGGIPIFGSILTPMLSSQITAWQTQGVQAATQWAMTGANNLMTDSGLAGTIGNIGDGLAQAFSGIFGGGGNNNQQATNQAAQQAAQQSTMASFNTGAGAVGTVGANSSTPAYLMDGSAQMLASNIGQTGDIFSTAAFVGGVETTANAVYYANPGTGTQASNASVTTQGTAATAGAVLSPTGVAAQQAQAIAANTTAGSMVAASNNGQNSSLDQLGVMTTMLAQLGSMNATQIQQGSTNTILAAAQAKQSASAAQSQNDKDKATIAGRIAAQNDYNNSIGAVAMMTQIVNPNPYASTTTP